MTDVALHRLGGAGPDVLLIHGIGADRMSWLALAPQLFEFTTVWAAEYAAHGTAGNDAGDGAPETLANAIEAEVTGRFFRPLIIGHSLGGTLALHLTARATLDVSGLLLLAPAGLAGHDTGDFIDRLPELRDGDAALKLLRRLVVRKTLITQRMADAFVQSLEDDARRSALRIIAKGLKTAPSVVFPQNTPCSILWGDSDDVARFPDELSVDTRVLENVGHLPHIEAVEDVVMEVRRLLSNRPQTT